ncbi:MAG: efflux RND transporter periplasmic adaptor subunit [Bacteroidales bacterium]|nr:efflux RND transporter periplasmic adaptor subunit [Bacteroidales bacterium]
MKNKKILILVAGILLIIVLFKIFANTGEDKKMLKVPVKYGTFNINITTTGELEAKSSEKIYGPEGLRAVRIYQVKIEDMIPDGTLVDSGQYVASLDKTEISNKIKDTQTELEKLESQYTKTKLDTSLDLRSARDELINLNFSLEEKKITLEQSKYEPPATIRQVKNDLEKVKRAYNQALKNYKLKTQKAKANMREITADLTKAKRKYERMLDVMKEFTVKAPKSGMVIYKRAWDGSKQGIGSTLSAWDNIVATLPDLSKMISKTYINEIDISKVKTQQKVEIGVDAFPEKKFTGKVIEVANIGEQLRNSNAKVFEVKILVNEFDSILRPAMTTKNKIITSVIDSVLFIPIEGVHNNDSISFVYKKSGSRIVKQQVITGKSNENEIIIKKGLKKDDFIFLNTPENADDLKIKTL